MTHFPDAKGRDSKCDFASFFTTNVFISITQTHAHFYKSVVIRNKNDYSIRTKATERIEWMQKRQSGNKNVKKKNNHIFFGEEKDKVLFFCCRCCHQNEGLFYCYSTYTNKFNFFCFQFVTVFFSSAVHFQFSSFGIIFGNFLRRYFSVRDVPIWKTGNWYRRMENGDYSFCCHLSISSSK